MNAKSSLRRYLAIIQGGGWKPLVSVFTLGLFSVSSAFGATYYWKGVNYVSSTFDATAGYGSWSELTNWSTESATGADATALPGADDSIYGLVKNTWRQFDLDGREWSIYGWHTTGDWDRHNWRFRNGTLHWTGVKNTSDPYNSNNCTHSDTVHLDDGATFIMDAGSYYCASFNHASADEWRVHADASLSMLGEIQIYKVNAEVYDGGEMVFAPSPVYFYSGTGQRSYLQNSGSLTIPNGVSFTEGASNGTFEIRQLAGTLTLGGAITKNGKDGTYKMLLSGGTVRITGDVSTDFDTSVSGTVTFEMSEGAALDANGFSYAAGAVVTKTGVGDFVFTDGMPLADSFTVAKGGLLLPTSGSYDISGVAFTSGGFVKIGAEGVTLSAFDASIANAGFALADGFAPNTGAIVFTCSDATVLAQAQTGLNAALAGTGITLEVAGTSLVAESHYAFNSSTVTDMNNPVGWVNNIIAPAGQPVIISGSATEAVMDSAVPGYSEISVTDGATLTVAATRDLPALTLEAGTSLKVAPVTGAFEQSHDGCIPHSSAVVVGTMDPSASITTLSDFSAKTAGTSFNSGSDITSILAKSLDDGETLLVQFKKHDDGHVKCAIVKFWQTDGTIYAQLVAARYWTTSASNIGHDFINADGTYNQNSFDMADTDSSRGYSVKSLSFAAPVAGLPSTVTAVGEFIAAGSGSVTVDVASDCVLDLSGVDVTTEATLVKTGDGAIFFGDELPTGLTVQAGALALQPYVEYDMTGVTIGQNATVKVAVDGELRPCIPTPGQNGTTVYMSGDTYVGVGGWNTLANWASGSLPDASAAVHVYGGDTVLALDAVPAVMPASISVEGGATLKVLADVVLPPLSVDATSKVVFGDNETQPAVSATLDASLTTASDATATPVALSVIEISTNATLSVASGTKFKDVDIRIYGTITKGSVDDLSPVFGYAEDGKTSYLAMAVDGGVFDFHSNQNIPRGSVSIVCPASGGTVIPVGTIILRNASRTVNGWADFGNWEFGVKNPVSVPFDVQIDGVTMDVSAYFYASGAAHLTLVNGSCVKRNGSCLGHWFPMAIQDSATIDVGTGCYIDMTTGDGSFAIDSQSAVDSVTVRNGGAYAVSYNSSGWGRGLFVSDGGVLGVGKIYGSRDRNDLLRGFGSARLDGDLDIASVNIGTGNTNWDRHVKVASGVPFTGTGDVVVTNGVPAYPFTVTMQNGANTATGSIKVAKVEGDAETALYFANGANWAGTVVAGNVALTNLTDVATAATATFGTLDLAADFPIRVWKGNGVYTADAINVGAFVAHGGKLSPVMMSDGEDFDKGDSFVVGKVAKGATLPAVATGWAVKARPIDGDDAYDEIVLKSGVGFQIIIR